MIALALLRGHGDRRLMSVSGERRKKAGRGRSATSQTVVMPPSIDATERFPLRLFLRRYVTWCARRKRFAQMQGVARLLGEC